jgi:hypothetical protein
MRFPRDRPPSSIRFDLIVVSEVGYHWSWDDLDAAQDAIEQQLEAEGHLILVHWTPPVLDYPLTGDEVHESFLRRPAFKSLHGHRTNCYRLNVLERKSCCFTPLMADGQR